jgi:hypothetical protein
LTDIHTNDFRARILYHFFDCFGPFRVALSTSSIMGLHLEVKF